MTTTKLQPIPNSFEELVKYPDFKLTMEDNFVLTNLILVSLFSPFFSFFFKTWLIREMITYYLLQNAKSGPMKLLGDSLRQNPKSIVTTSFEAAENVRKHNFVYFGVIVLQINQKIPSISL